jgi:hypothetical protein
MERSVDQPAPPFRGTLAAISGLYALFNAAIGIVAWSEGLYPRLMVAYGATLAGAGLLHLRSRRAGIPLVLLAAAAAIGFAVFDLRRGSFQAAAVDAAYAPIALILLRLGRSRA